MPDHVLLVEDERELREFLSEILEDAGYVVSAFPTAETALARLESVPVDIVVTDLILPGMRGHELLAEIRTRQPELNVIVITAFGSIDSAIQLVKQGAYDYLTKPFSTDELLLTLERGLEESRLRREVAGLRRGGAVPLPGFVGASRPIQELYALLRRIGSSSMPALVTGESGTGKELVARALHTLSGRGAFLPVNCSAFTESLLEAELFGHEKGAFTGADRMRTGLFEAAHRGTLFLDEVGDLPPALQPKLLRALESGEVRRVGATEARTVDVRVIAATNKDLEAEVEAGRFREDLFWRLNVLHIPIPPLRDRVADIPLLAEHFAGHHEITPAAMALLTAYSWPGNIRELRNAVDRAVAMGGDSPIRPEDLPPRVQKAARSASIVSQATRRRVSLRDLEREYVLEILREVGGNKTRAAEILGLDRKTLYRKVEEYGQEGLLPD